MGRRMGKQGKKGFVKSPLGKEGGKENGQKVVDGGQGKIVVSVEGVW